MNYVPAAVCRCFYKVLSFKRVDLDFYLSLGSVELVKSVDKDTM